MNAKTSILAAIALAAAPAFSEKWDPVPLGEPGTLKVETKLRNEPKLVDAIPKRPDGIVLFDGSRAAVVAADFKNGTLKRFADEVRWHLEEMTGRIVDLVNAADATPSPETPVIEVAELDVPSQTAVLKIEGDKVLIGGDGPGISHAMTYFLESLGCRYLWPGKTGKVIPKKKRVVLPQISLNEAPKLDYIRRIWAPSARLGGDEGRGAESAKIMGIDRKAFVKRYAECLRDRPENRSFYNWHGFGDRLLYKSKNTKPTVQDAYDGGHYFNHYYKKYSKEHPDWFALQPDGTRINRYKRPRLCLSNEGLIQEVIRDRIAYFKAHPGKRSASLCMPDGDRDSVCMCEGCRRLDPVNAEPRRFGYYTPVRGYTNYVALTDRVLWFCNRVAEGVLKEYPGKQFKTFIYAGYQRPPVKVKPHPSLVLFNVAGSVGSVASIGKEVSSIAAFAPLGNPLVWRPNILHSYQAQLPQNYARIVYEDVVRFKENNVRGVSFDCCSGAYALKGFIFYMLGRSLFNYDNLSYEGQLADYCRCFGAAAPYVRKYLDELEKIHWRAAKGEGLFQIYPVDELGAILDAGAAKVANDPEALERVKFLQKGITIAREEMKLYKAWYTTHWKPLLAARKEYKAFIREMCMDDPIAVHPGSIGFKGPFIRGTPRRTPEQRAAASAKRAARRAKKAGKAGAETAAQEDGYTDEEGNFKSFDEQDVP